MQSQPWQRTTVLVLAIAVLGLGAIGTSPPWPVDWVLLGILLLLMAVEAARTVRSGRVRRLFPRWSVVAKWLGRPAPAPLHASATANWLQALQLGRSALPLVQGVATPMLEVRLHDTTVVLTLRSVEHTVVAAVERTRVVALHCWYPEHLHDLPMAGLVADIERYLPPEDRLPERHRLELRPDGWVLSTPECSAAALAAVDTR